MMSMTTVKHKFASQTLPFSSLLETNNMPNALSRISDLESEFGENVQELISRLREFGNSCVEQYEQLRQEFGRKRMAMCKYAEGMEILSIADAYASEYLVLDEPKHLAEINCLDYEMDDVEEELGKE